MRRFFKKEIIEKCSKDRLYALIDAKDIVLCIWKQDSKNEISQLLLNALKDLKKAIHFLGEEYER